MPQAWTPAQHKKFSKTMAAKRKFKKAQTQSFPIDIIPKKQASKPRLVRRAAPDRIALALLVMQFLNKILDSE